ncbi:MAG: 2Fe-2S iron-sulfur cluster binding domain-containing protein [Magnetospirillum gryphiswaldense]|nr:2Fe-2S iron-sulfur cluster binding domain-containing protein [Magnetospirillum gryphiswaldense]
MISVLVLSALILAAGAAIAVPVAGLSCSAWSWWVRRQARPLPLRVVARRELSPEAFEIVLSPPPWRLFLPAFRPGQHVVLDVPVETGRVARRAYTLAAWTVRPRRYVLAIKREEAGLVSPWLHRHAQPGLRLNASPPKGVFHALLADGADHVVLVAAGIGITPMRAMLHAWGKQASPPQVVLHYTARHRAGLYYHDEFTALATTCPWFRYVPRLTGDNWDGESGRLSVDRVAADMTDPGRTQVFICAGKAMEDVLVAALPGLGIDPARIRREAFGVPAIATDIEARISFRGHSFAFAGAPTLLHALEREKLAVAAECRAGECGECRLTITQGRTRNLLTGTEDSQSTLVCCSVPVGDVGLAG